MHTLRPQAAVARILVGCIAVIASGCAKPPAPGSPPILKIAAALPSEAERRRGFAALVDSLTTDSFVVYAPDGRPLPHLATSWEWDDSHTQLTMQLRQDVVFHDGSRLTAEAAAASLRKSAADHEALSLASIREVSAVAGDKIKIELTQPDAFLLPDLAGVTVNPANPAAGGTGPFKVVNVEPERISLEANPRYYRGRPAFQRVEMIRYPSQRKAWSAMMRGEVDVLHDVSREAVDFVEAETSVHAYSFPRAYYLPVVFNVRNAVLRNPQVRRAVNMAINRAALVSDSLHGRGRPADGPMWPEHWAYVPPRHPFGYDPDAARAMLDGAGFPLRPAADGMPRRFAFTCMVFAEDTRFERIALLIQKQLYDVGVDMKLEPVTARQFAQRASAGEFDALLGEMYGKSLSWVYAFWHSPEGTRPFINTGYNSADAPLDHLRHAVSDEDTRAAMRELNDILQNDPPAAFLVWPAQARAVSSRVAVPDEPNRDVLSTVWQWRAAPAQVASR